MKFKLVQITRKNVEQPTTDNTIISRKHHNKMEKRKGINEAKRRFVTLFREYCGCSTIHGVQYVGDPERTVMEKMYWIIIFIISCCCNFYMIWQLWNKWQTTPVIVSFSENTTPIWQVPFPAITICPQVIARRDDFDFEHLMTSKDKLDEENHWKVSAMSLLCTTDVEIEGTETLDGKEVQFLSDIAPSMEDTLIVCKMGNDIVNCTDYFHRVFTEDGLCYTTNVLKKSELFRQPSQVRPYPDNLPKSEHWTLDNGYERGSPIDTYPRRAIKSGDKSGFLIAMASEKTDHDVLCRGAMPGFRVMLHNPAEVPSSSSKYIRIPTDQELLVWVEPSIMTTGDELRSYSYESRQCFYPYERDLKYFKIYTERNCELECTTNHTLKVCGCVALHMPRDEDTPVCGGGKSRCLKDAINSLQLEEVKRNYEGLTTDSCNCLPACTSIRYLTETSQTSYNWRQTLEATGESTEHLEGTTISRVTIFFSETHFTTSHRSELFGVVDFLANCGGLLGLFSGISFLSFLEIIYFCTLRRWGNLKKQRRQIQRENNDETTIGELTER